MPWVSTLDDHGSPKKVFARELKRPSPRVPGQWLEIQARRLLQRQSSYLWEEDPAKVLVRETALVLDHLDQLRLSHRNFRLDLSRQEFELEVRLEQLNKPYRILSPADIATKGRIETRLWEIQREKRHLQIDEEEKGQVLRERLLSLVDRQVLLGISDEPNKGDIRLRKALGNKGRGRFGGGVGKDSERGQGHGR